MKGFGVLCKLSLWFLWVVGGCGGGGRGFFDGGGVERRVGDLLRILPMQSLEGSPTGTELNIVPAPQF